jgi:hypothetical protein
VRRGVSPVVTSTLLILISISIVALLYPWATAATNKVASAISQDSESAQEQILSNVVIRVPGAENPQNKPQPVLVHNVGLTTLNNVKVWIATNNGTDLNAAKGEYIENNGDSTTVDFSTTTLSAFRPGEALVIWLPAEQNYDGWSIIFTSKQYSTSETIGG